MPFTPDATCGKNAGNAEKKGNGIFNDSGAGQKYRFTCIDLATGENLTAELLAQTFCKNYDSARTQMIKCVAKAKGAAKKKQTKGKAFMRCNSGEGTSLDTAVCKFYTRFQN